MASAAISHVDPEIAERFAALIEQDETPTPTEPTQIAQPNEAPSEEESRPPVEEPTDEEPIAADADASDEAPLEEPSQDPEAEADEVSTVAQLAALFEGEDVTEDSLLDLQVDGREGETVSLREALEVYRHGPTEDQHFTARVEAKHTELRQEHDQRLEELNQVTAGLIAQTQAEFSHVDWDDLRANDAPEFIRQQDRQSQVHGQVKTALDAMDAEMTRQKSDDAAKHAVWQTEQVSVLHRLHPEWKNTAASTAAMTEVRNYLVESGFSSEMQAALEDALSINTVWEAAQYRKIQAAKPGLRKRLRSLPKTLRATARAAEPAPHEAQQKDRAARVSAHRKMGTVASAAKVFEEFV